MDTYNIFRLAQVFDPSYAAANLTPAMVDDLMVIIPLANLNLLAGLKQELPAYLTATANCQGFNRTEIHECAAPPRLPRLWPIPPLAHPTTRQDCRRRSGFRPGSSASVSRALPSAFNLSQLPFTSAPLALFGRYTEGVLLLWRNVRGRLRPGGAEECVPPRGARRGRPAQGQPA